MYCGVPARVPYWVSLVSSTARARPKSVSFTRGSVVLQHDVARLDVAVDQALRVRRGQPGGDLQPIRRISLQLERVRPRRSAAGAMAR